ncbi:MAG: DUF2326 domain-containing protein [Candidatus Aenigmarchaeota archaeon]|nr:DUF2326 domain-containing protein [Candidatus Aenigmarchaeota archaeon]
MFLKSLKITRGNGEVIRDIHFHEGINLIVDETPVDGGTATGNNVGKTTVLKLVDFCLGADKKKIYTETENKKNEYQLVKEFLIENKVLISLVLKDDLSDEDSREVLIERNFLSRSKKIQRIDGEDKTDDEFKEALTDLLFPGHFGKKPTFRQIISHNIRYKDISINNTLKTLDNYTSDNEYETLYLFLFGCNFEQGDRKQELCEKIKLEEKFQNRLESEHTKSAYESALAVLKSEIEELEAKKGSLNLNPDFESDLDKLNQLKYKANVTSSEIGRLQLRKKLILEAKTEMEAGVSSIDLNQLRQIYEQATTLVSGIQKSFEDLQEFHNRMVESKIRFITQDLPKIEDELSKQHQKLKRLLSEESEVNTKIIQSDSYEDLETMISELNAKYQKMGEFESILNQLNTVESNLTELNNELAKIDDVLFSEEFRSGIQEQINKFSSCFSKVSNRLYGEKYALKLDTVTRKGRRIYKFNPFNLNFSTGKKQGEIVCFDIAYILFADEENIPCMHFLLNDKKELMDDNQLLRIAELVNENGIQFVASILKNRLPGELNQEEYVVIKLSQQDKLFRIESESTRLAPTD